MQKANCTNPSTLDSAPCFKQQKCITNGNCDYDMVSLKGSSVSCCHNNLSVGTLPTGVNVKIFISLALMLQKMCL